MKVERPDTEAREEFDSELFLTLPPVIRHKIYEYFTLKRNTTVCEFTARSLVAPGPHELFFHIDSRVEDRTAHLSYLRDQYLQRFPHVNEGDLIGSLIEIEEQSPSTAIASFIKSYIAYSIWISYDCVLLDYLRVNRGEDFWYLKMSTNGVFSKNWEDWVMYKRNVNNLITVQYKLSFFIQKIQQDNEYDDIVCIRNDFFTMEGLSLADIHGTETFLEWFRAVKMIDVELNNNNNTDNNTDNNNKNKNKEMGCFSMDRLQYLDHITKLKLRITNLKKFQIFLQKIAENRFPVDEVFIDFDKYEEDTDQWFRMNFFKKIPLKSLKIVNYQGMLILEDFISVLLKFNKNLTFLQFYNVSKIKWPKRDSSIWELLKFYKIDIIFHNDCEFITQFNDLYIPIDIYTNLQTIGNKLYLNKTRIIFH